MPKARAEGRSVTLYSTGLEKSGFCLAKAAFPSRPAGITSLRANSSVSHPALLTKPQSRKTSGDFFFAIFSKRQSQTLQVLYQKPLWKARCKGLNLLYLNYYSKYPCLAWPGSKEGFRTCSAKLRAGMGSSKVQSTTYKQGDSAGKTWALLISRCADQTP